MGHGQGKTDQESDFRARSNNPRFPWQAPHPTLSSWLTGTKKWSRSTVTHTTSLDPPTAATRPASSPPTVATKWPRPLN